MLLLFGGWVFFGGAITGLGAGLTRLYHVADCESQSLTSCFWSGLAALVALLQIINLFAAIDWKIVVLIVAIGWAFLFLSASRVELPWVSRPSALGTRDSGRATRDSGLGTREGGLGTRDGGLRTRDSGLGTRDSVPGTRDSGLGTIHWIVLVLLGLWISNHALAAPSGDDGLYHLASVRWANEYRLPPGIGNLHERLAFNQSFFLLVAFLNSLPVPGFGHSLANSLLIMALLWTITERQIREPRIELSLLIPVTLYYLLSALGDSTFFANATPDVAVFALETVLFIYALELSDGPPQNVNLLLAMAALAVTFKLYTLAFSVGTLLLTGWWICRKNIVARHRLRIGSALCAILLIGWIIRSVVASGCLVFPVAATTLPVPWRVPVHLTVNSANWIRSWAREPFMHWSIVLGSNDWIQTWIPRTIRHPAVQAPLFLAVLALVARMIVRPTQEPGRAFLLRGFVLVAIGSLGFWFFTAPDPRFLGAIIWILAISLTALAFPPRAARARIGVLILFWLMPIYGLILVGYDMVRVPPGHLMQPVPNVPMRTRQTTSGLIVLVPVTGNQCWDAPLPCTPYFRPQLRLLGPGQGDGFWLDESAGRESDF